LSDTLMVMCPCGIPFVVTLKWLKDHPAAIWECQGMTGKRDNYKICERKYSAATLEKEFWRGTYYPDNY
jgi:hypothetical protein